MVYVKDMMYNFFIHIVVALPHYSVDTVPICIEYAVAHLL